MRKLSLIMLFATLMFSCGQTDTNDSKLHQKPDTQLYYNGRIITMESSENPYVEAVVEQEGKIVFVGSIDEAETLFLI